MPSEYILSYQTPGGNFVTNLQYAQFDLTCKEIDIGTLNISFHPRYYSPSFFVRDGIIEIWRRMGLNNTQLVGKTFWLIRRVSYKIDSSGNESLQVTAQDANSILKKRLVAYNTGSVYSAKTDFADDMMKAIVRENFNTLAIEADRDIHDWFYIDPNVSAGPIVTREVGWKNLFDELVGISTNSAELAGRILFTTERVGNAQVVFRTHKDYIGADHTAQSQYPVIVSQEMGNLSTPEMTFDYTDEKTAVYAMGAGSGETRTYQTAIDKTRISGPFGRIETTVDGGDQVDVNVIKNLANENLYKGRPRLIFDGILLDSPFYQYGVHFDYGDLVTANYRGYSLNCSLSTLGLSFGQKDGEQIQLRMHGEVVL